MSKNGPANSGHSIFQRLLNQAKADGDDFQLLMLRYGMERFLYRLSISSYKEFFILKGASLFLVWLGHNHRVTRDADLLGFGALDLQGIADVFRSVCGLECDADGMKYQAETVKVIEIREGQKYDGIRVTLVGMLNTARIPLQIDIGFGDAVTPEPEIVDYPTIFDAPAPKLKAYSRYTLVAEKLEAIVQLGLANSRMKDFYDIWLVSRIFEFEGTVLQNALKRTFERRGSEIPADCPFAFTPDFYNDQQKQMQWNSFIKKAKPETSVEICIYTHLRKVASFVKTLI